ncbi:MAG: hypothetical protein GY705_29250 [Bacteroidetes bacterium]|nr:hypothetical protein [Bacteroidota bacterium]
MKPSPIGLFTDEMINVIKELKRKYKLNEFIFGTESSNMKDYLKFLIDNTIRNLLPEEEYNFLEVKVIENGTFYQANFLINGQEISIKTRTDTSYLSYDYFEKLNEMEKASKRNFRIHSIITDGIKSIGEDWLVSAPEDIIEKAREEGLPISTKDSRFWYIDLKRRKLDETKAYNLTAKLESQINNTERLEKAFFEAAKRLVKFGRMPNITEAQIRMIADKKGGFYIILGGEFVSYGNSFFENTIKTRSRNPGIILLYGVIKKYGGSVTFEPTPKNPDKEIKTMEGEAYLRWVEEQLSHQDGGK